MAAWRSSQPYPRSCCCLACVGRGCVLAPDIPASRSRDSPAALVRALAANADRCVASGDDAVLCPRLRRCQQHGRRLQGAALLPDVILLTTQTCSSKRELRRRNVDTLYSQKTPRNDNQQQRYVCGNPADYRMMNNE